MDNSFKLRLSQSFANPRVIKRLVCLLLVAFIGVSARSAGLDRNGNTLNDAWELLYGTLVPVSDEDGDGFTNAEESAAGTNPFDALSQPPFLAIAPWPDSFARFDWNCVMGKQYSLLSRTNVAVGSWTTNVSLLADGPVGTAWLSSTNAQFSFFRLVVHDVDGDNDGLTDWEELTLGFNPGTAHSDRQDELDYFRATNAISASSVVSMGTLDPLMTERWPDPGLVAVRRANGLKPLTVNLAFNGTATKGVDYTTSVGTNISFPLGVREVWIELHPIADADDTEPTETVSITLQPGTGYTIGPSNTSTLTLENETDASGPSMKSSARFLIQAAFGPDLAPLNGVSPNLSVVMSLGFTNWIDDQFTRPHGYLQPWVDWASARASALQLYGNWKEFSWWGRAMGSPKLRPDAATNTLADPLRQRVAFALSEILVASDRPEALAVEPAGMANYYDVLVRHAFGNFRELLYDVATHPVMGIYLSHLGNQKADPASRIYPDENFAREIMQLFSIGLWQLNPDGTLVLTNGQPVATYDNSHITELARVFTGFTFGTNSSFTLWPRDFTVPMKCWDAFHDTGPKTLLGGLQLPARPASPGNSGTAGLADVNAAVSNLFAHPNVGPFLGKQLIQRLVTSNPGTGYVARVSAAFADNGSGTRGDMKAVVKAILLDPEARDPVMMDQPTWGKLREPFLRVVNFARAFNAASTSGYYPLDQFSLDHLQDPMNAPSVFNFFLPAHSPPGPITQMGLVAPEFQIINASSAITGPNYFWDDAILGGMHTQGAGNPSYAVRPSITNELALIVPASQINQDVPTGSPADPDALIRRLDLVLTGGTLSAPQFQIIREAMLRINPPTWQWHRERLRLAVYLIVTSPDFNVLR